MKKREYICDFFGKMTFFFKKNKYNFFVKNLYFHPATKFGMIFSHPTKTNIIEMYKTRKCYVPAFMCRRFSNGCPNFDFDYYHYILEIRHIPFNTEDDVQSQPSMNSSISILSVSLPLYCHRVNTGK